MAMFWEAHWSLRGMVKGANRDTRRHEKGRLNKNV